MTISSSAVTFHAVAFNQETTVYYTAVAHLQSQDEGIVLNYKEQDPDTLFPIFKEAIQENLHSFDRRIPNSNDYTVFDGISANLDVSSPAVFKERLSRIRSVFVTCACSPSLKNRSSSIIHSIGLQCRKKFPNMKIEESFFKVKAGDKYYDHTFELERNIERGPGFSCICMYWRELSESLNKFTDDL